MKTYRLWVIAPAAAVKALKARAVAADIPFQEYLGLLLVAAAQADPIEVPQHRSADTGKSFRSDDYPAAA
jgi:hypothetical protein